MHIIRSLVLTAIFTAAAFAQTYGLTPVPKMQFLDSSGNPLASGLVYTYAAGTTTPLQTYTDSTGGTPNANPIVLDSGGRAAIWLATDTAYKIVVQTSGGVTVTTTDNVSAAPLNTATLDTAQTFTAAKTFSGPVTIQNLTVTGSCTGCASGGGGGGGGSAFSAITSGTNTSATMTVGAGSTLQTASTGVVNFGTAGATTPAAKGLVAALPGTCGVGQVYFATDATAGANNYYCTAANTWTQHLSGAGGAAFNAITGGTNTGAAMLVGAGASLGPTSTGTVKATSLVDSNQLAVLTSSATASAVNYINFTNGATGSPGIVSMAAAGSDTNINLLIQSKGSGVVQLGSSNATVDASGNLVVAGCTGCGGGGGSSLPVTDATSIVYANGDATKQVRFSLIGLTTASTRVLTVQDASYTLAGLETPQTFSGALILSGGANVSANTLGILSGATFSMSAGSTSSIATDWLPGSTGTRSVGSASLKWLHGYFSGVVHTFSLEADSSTSSVNNAGRFSNNTVSQPAVVIGNSAVGGVALSVGPGKLQFASNIELGGALTQYNGVTTNALGMAPIYYYLNATGATTGVTANLLYNGGQAPAGVYRVNVVLRCSATGSSGAIQPQIKTNGGITWNLDGSNFINCTGTSEVHPAPFVFRHDGTGHIIFLGTLLATFAGGAAYDYQVFLERLN